MMTCQGMSVVLDTCLAVVAVVRVNAQSFAYARRFGAALQTQFNLPDSCCKTSSTSRPQNATTALLALCSVFNK